MTDSNKAASAASALIGRFFVDVEDDATFTVTTYNKGWFTLTSIDDERIEMKLRKADVDNGIQGQDYDPSDEDEDEDKVSKMAKQLSKYRETYVVGIAPSGRKSLHNGSVIALMLEGCTLDEVYTQTRVLLGEDFTGRYAHLNQGSQRMNLGNRLRAAHKKGDNVLLNSWVESFKQ
jgi:hypothetical protein